MPASTPESIHITSAQLWALIGAAVSIIATLIAVLWNLLLERVKKCETRLDEGATTIADIKLDLREVQTRQDDCSKCP